MLPPRRPEDVTGLPDDIALLHHFANTEDRREFVAHGQRLAPYESLATPADLMRWLREHDLLAAGEQADETHLERARALRASLRAAVRQEGESRLDFPMAVTLGGRGGVLEVAGDSVTAALGRIAVAAVTATATGAWQRLRMCPAPDCQWVFYDQSRPGRARWCSPRLCGNRAKTQAYRQRPTGRRNERQGAGTGARVVPDQSPCTEAELRGS